MVTFKCTLPPSSITSLSHTLTCLSRFHESVNLEISARGFTLVAINRMQTTCASITLAPTHFFSTYSFLGEDEFDDDARFRCSLYNKTLAAVFHGRSGVDAGRDAEAAVERCEIALLEDPGRVDCRLVVTMVSRSGVRRIYRLHYEASEVLRAVFNREAAGNRWAMSAFMLKAFSEYFGPRTDLLDLYGEEGRVTITSYTEKVTKGKDEVLRQPLQTQIEVDATDFADYVVEDGMHVGISVKDFRAIVVHAETLKTAVTARFGRPGRPMLLAYEEGGMLCEYTLSTTGQYRGSKTPTPVPGKQASGLPQRLSVAPQAPNPTTAKSSVPASDRAASIRVQENGQASAMPPPSKPASRTIPIAPSTQHSVPHFPGTQSSAQNLMITAKAVRPPASVRSASVDEESLFVEQDNNDQQWDEANYEADDQDKLGWGDSAETPLRTLTQVSTTRRDSVVKESFATEEHETHTYRDDEEVPPTQEITGLKGLFD